MQRLPSAYVVSLRAAGQLLHVPRLAGATWTPDPNPSLRRPKIWSGGYAVVFQARDRQGRSWALRCPLSEAANSEQQYRVVSDYLAVNPLPYLINFEHVPRGIVVDGVPVSVTVSEWVHGETIKDFVGGHLQAVAKLRQAWAEVASDMVRRGIAHGDIHHENVLVSGPADNPRIKLIDYDSFVVPANVGYPEPVGGFPAYQHPMRVTKVCHKHPRVDAFSLLIMDLSLLALEVDPSLWTTLDAESADGFILSKDDLLEPGKSHPFTRLCALGGPVEILARAVLRALAQPDPLQVPYPWELLGSTGSTTSAMRQSPTVSNLPAWMVKASGRQGIPAPQDLSPASPAGANMALPAWIAARKATMASGQAPSSTAATPAAGPLSATTSLTAASPTTATTRSAHPRGLGNRAIVSLRALSGPAQAVFWITALILLVTVPNCIWQSYKASTIQGILDGQYDTRDSCNKDRRFDKWLRWADEAAESIPGERAVLSEVADDQSTSTVLVPRYRLLACIELERATFVAARRSKVDKSLRKVVDLARTELERRLPRYLDEKYSIADNLINDLKDLIVMTVAVVAEGLTVIDQGAGLLDGSQRVVQAALDNISAYSDGLEGRRRQELVQSSLMLLDAASSALDVWPEAPSDEAKAFVNSIASRLLPRRRVHVAIDDFEFRLENAQPPHFAGGDAIFERDESTRRLSGIVVGKVVDKAADRGLGKARTVSRKMLRAVSKNLIASIAMAFATNVLFRDGDAEKIKTEFATQLDLWREGVVTEHEQQVQAWAAVVSGRFFERAMAGTLTVASGIGGNPGPRAVSSETPSKETDRAEAQASAPQADEVAVMAPPPRRPDPEEEQEPQANRPQGRSDVHADGRPTDFEIGEPWVVRLSSASDVEEVRAQVRQFWRRGISAKLVLKIDKYCVVVEQASETDAISAAPDLERVLITHGFRIHRFEDWCPSPVYERDGDLEYAKCRDYVIVASASHDLVTIEREAQIARRHDYDTRIVKKDGFYRLLVGPFGSRGEAESHEDTVTASLNKERVLAQHFRNWCGDTTDDPSGDEVCSR